MRCSIHFCLPRLPYRALRVCSFCALLAALSACHEEGLSTPEPPESLDASANGAASESLDARAAALPAKREDAGPSRPSIDAGSAAQAGLGDASGWSSVVRDTTADTALGADAARDGASVPVNRSSGFVVGTRRIDVTSDAGRVLPVQLWYPAVDEAAAEAEAGHATTEFEAPGGRRELLETLLEQARASCPKLTMHAALGAAPYPRSAPFPLLVYSHHFNGSRFSMFSIAEALAREGMVVAAPDHVDGTLFDRTDVLSDALRQFNEAFLRTRAADLRRLLDVLLDATSEVVPADLRGRLDAQRVGALGHSLGGITVGLFSVNDTRVRASLYLAIIPSQALSQVLFGLPAPQQFRTPALYLTAHEDTTVDAQGGSAELAANYEGQPLPATWIDVRDTGHFSFADDCGLVPELDEGCGTAQRITSGESFTYLDPERARAIAAHYSAAFFAVQFLGAPPARLADPQPPSLVTVKQRGAKDAAP